MKRFAKVIVLKKNGQGGSEFPLPSGRCSIGRDPDCDICIQSDGVLAFHCLIIIDAKNQAHLVNVSGSAELSLNGEPILNEAFLTHGDKFTILSREFCFEWCLKTIMKKPEATPSPTPSRSFYGQSGTCSLTRSTRNAVSFQTEALENTAASETFLEQTAYKTPQIPPEVFVSPLQNSVSTEQNSTSALKSPQTPNLGTPVNKLSRKRTFSPASPANSVLGLRASASSSSHASPAKKSLGKTEIISTSTPFARRFQTRGSKQDSADEFACNSNASTRHINSSSQSPKAEASRRYSRSSRQQSCTAEQGVQCRSSASKSGTIRMSRNSVISSSFLADSEDCPNISSSSKQSFEVSTPPLRESVADWSLIKITPEVCSPSASLSRSKSVQQSQTPIGAQTAQKSMTSSSFASASGSASSLRSRSTSAKRLANVTSSSRRSSSAEVSFHSNTSSVSARHRRHPCKDEDQSDSGSIAQIGDTSTNCGTDENLFQNGLHGSSLPHRISGMRPVYSPSCSSTMNGSPNHVPHEISKLSSHQSFCGTDVEEMSPSPGFKLDESLHNSPEHSRSRRSEKSKGTVAGNSSMRTTKSQQGSPQNARAIEVEDTSPSPRSLTGTAKQGPPQHSLRRTSARFSGAASTTKRPQTGAPQGTSLLHSPRRSLDSKVGNRKLKNLTSAHGGEEKSPEPGLLSKSATESTKPVPHLTACSTPRTIAQSSPPKILQGSPQLSSIQTLPCSSVSAKRRHEISLSCKPLTGSSNNSPKHTLQTSPFPGKNELPSTITKASPKSILHGTSHPQSPEVVYGLHGLDYEQENCSLAGHRTRRSQGSINSKKDSMLGSPATRSTNKDMPVRNLRGIAKAVPHQSPSTAHTGIHSPSRASQLISGDNSLLQKSLEEPQPSVKASSVTKTNKDAAAAMPVYAVNEGASTSAASFAVSPPSSRKRPVDQPGSSDGSPAKRSLLEDRQRNTRGSEIPAVQYGKSKRAKKAASKSSLVPGSPSASPEASQAPRATSPVRRPRRKAAVAAEEAFTTKRVPPKTRRGRKGKAGDDDSTAVDSEVSMTQLKETKGRKTLKGTPRKPRKSP